VLIQCEAGEYGTVLQAAAYRGFVKIPELIFEHSQNVDPNALGEYFGVPLEK
jgi:hypothetical protein